MKVVGVDGCKAGWIAAVLETSTNLISFEPFGNIATLVSVHGEAACITIDIPIGLVDGPRQCDVEARQFIKPRSSSVFPAPCRAVLGCSDYATGQAVSINATGKSLSRQAFAISPKIREVDEVMTPELQARVREIHPEVCFTAMNGRAMEFHKAKFLGFEERFAALQRALPGNNIPGADSAARAFRGVEPDDMLDAAAAAWSAARVAAGTFRTLPADPHLDARGLRMEMVY